VATEREECRADPALDYRLVTYGEMCCRLSDQHLSDSQLWSRWQNLHPSEAGAIIASLTSAEVDASIAGSSVAAGCAPRSFEPELRRGLACVPPVEQPESLTEDFAGLHYGPLRGDAIGSHLGSVEAPEPDLPAAVVPKAPTAAAAGPRRFAERPSTRGRYDESVDLPGGASAPTPAAWEEEVADTPSVSPILSAAEAPVLEKTVERTNLAILLEGMRHGPIVSPDDQIDAVLGDLVDSLLQSSHAESQRHLPASEHLVSRLGSNQRESILEWLVQACDIMRLQDGVLYSTVLMLDRYCAAAHEPLPMERMQKVLMAVICTVLKTCTVSDEVCMPLRDLLLHLCRRQVNFEEVLEMEHRVLRTLQFSGLCAPTPLDFIDAFCTPLAYGEPIESSMPRCIANFVVQLSLFNAALHYRYPHAILAAGGVYVALCSLHMPPVVHQTLLHDIVAICPEIPDVPARVAACASDLHGLWVEFANTQGNRVPCLLRKFSGTRLHQNAILTPPAALMSIAPACPPWSPGATTNARSSSPAERRCSQCKRRFLVSSSLAPESMPPARLCPHCQPRSGMPP